VRILGIAGSLRRGSYNRGLIRAAQELTPEGATFETFDVRSLPHYDGDLDALMEPAPVAALKDAIRSADAIVIATPEYNHGVPGPLKNAIDWASRPAAASVLAGKPIAIMGAGGRSGTSHAQEQLRKHLRSTRSEVLEVPVLAISHAWEHFDDNGNLIDLELHDQVGELMQNLANRVTATVSV
jgi:chromate reductase, NAD(P)H dehydrogenase (quinone)